jgi:poly-gamma-glutamate synthesis protein (capsule biosynthesis protein)
MRRLILSTLLITPIFAQYSATISNITPTIKSKMIKGHSYHYGCPVSLDKLRYLNITYRDFEGRDRVGELIVHQDIALDTIRVFQRLYEIGYPIRDMRLVSDFGGNDWQSIEADNTSAFNCRNATGTKHFSKHAYGKAIDINPLENPYISRKGHISHRASLKFRKRVHTKNSSEDKAIIKNGDKALEIFKMYHFQWGGEWHRVKDYQHFEHR